MENTQNNLPGAEGDEQRKNVAEANTEQTGPTSAQESSAQKAEETPAAGESETEGNGNKPAEGENPGKDAQAESPEKEKAQQAETTTGTAEESSSPSAEKQNNDEAAQAEEPDDKQAEETQHLSDEELENSDDTDEVQGEEDEHESQHPDELELPDYGEFTPEKLVAEAEKLLKQQPVQKLKDHMEAIRKSLLKQLNEERQEKLENFIEEGGVEMDFEYIQPLREKFRSIFSEYRSRRKKYYDELREKLELNLKTKKELIEQLKDIVTREESIGKTFKEFNAIIQEWRNTGPVPRSESHDLWQTYHHHVENFYEYIKINKELRDLDYKKNRSAKEELVQKAEGLSQMKDVPQAFRDLQKLHKEWKHIGPVEPENREPLWEKFSNITKAIHDKREEYYAELREKRGELIEEKKKLVEKIAAVNTDNTKHNQWQKAIKEVDELQKEFKKIGRLNHPENDAVWHSYREVTRNFNHLKNQFYKNLKKDYQENLEKKQALLNRAEELKDSTDWREATNEFKRLQADWKTIGHVPKKDSDKIWKQFRKACNHYFDRLTEHNKEKDQQFEGNLDKKKEILEELKALDTDPKDRKGTVEAIKEIINKWRSAGPVPKGKGKVEKTFNKLLDEKFEAVDMDRQEAVRIRFENKMKNLAEQGGDDKLKKERKALRQKLEEGKRELGQLQTNMSFFSSSNPNSPIVKEAENKIKKQEQAIARMEEQMKMLNVKIRKMAQAEDTAPENASPGTEAGKTEE